MCLELLKYTKENYFINIVIKVFNRDLLSHHLEEGKEILAEIVIRK